MAYVIALGLVWVREHARVKAWGWGFNLNPGPLPHGCWFVSWGQGEEEWGRCKV